MRRTRAIMTLLLAFAASVGLVLHCSDPQPSEPEETVVPVTEFEELSLTPQGGTYGLEGGLQVVVPAGAVDQDAVILMREIGREELEALAAARGTSADDVYIAIEGRPDGMVFNVPIEVRASTDVGPGECPIPYELDLEQRTATPAIATVGIDPDSNIVTLYLERLSGNSAASTAKQMQAPSGRSAELTSEQKAENERGQLDCQADLCRCGPMKRRVLDVDVMCQEGGSSCQIIDSREEYLYTICDKTYTGRRIEITGDCRPKMSLAAARTELATTQATDITARVWLGCESYPLRTTAVSYSSSDPADLSTQTQNTDDQGVSTVTLTARDQEGQADVTAHVQAVYYDTYQLTTGNGIEEPKYGNTIVKDTSASVSVDIKDKPLLSLVSDKTSMTGLEHATLTSTLKNGSAPVAGETVLVSVDGTGREGYSLYPFPGFGNETSSAGESVSRIQIREPGTHRVVATCYPTSIGTYEELSDTVTITTTAVEESWTGTMTINVP
ncbi:MAG: hypothetical protein GF331_05855, partial [Chitinivibrionales bacterium]|nr:hypothetical protein [Chitinivibrionales bacterium]